MTECKTIPEETAGPYPDKTGMLDDPAFYRQDVTEGKEGLPLTVELVVVDVNDSCAPVAGAVVEIWHCDADGNYSEYTQPGYDGTGETFLRGLQTADANGKVTFTTIYPGWYAGRVTHIHFDIYVNKNVVKTSQMAFPETITAEVYSQVSPYTAKGQNPTTNATDNIFSDGTSLQMASLSGDTTNGYKATLTVGVAL